MRGLGGSERHTADTQKIPMGEKERPKTPHYLRTESDKSKLLRCSASARLERDIHLSGADRC